jgi:hypothetical protein
VIEGAPNPFWISELIEVGILRKIIAVKANLSRFFVEYNIPSGTLF